MRRVALIVFYDGENRVLLQYRKGIASKFQEEWGYFGGKIEDGETPEQAVVRETKEELDFDLSGDFKFLGKFENKIKGFESEAFVFISPLVDKMEKFRQLEGEEMRLFSLEDAEKLKMGPGDKEILKELGKCLIKNE